MAWIIGMMIDRAISGEDFDLEEDEENLDIEEDWQEEGQPAWNCNDDAEPGLVKFGERMIELEKVQAAIAHYRATAKRSRPLSSMMAQFKWIKNANHMTKLLKFEKEGEVRANRADQLRALGCQLNEKIKENMLNGIVLHDNDIQREALMIGRTFGITGFKASHTWIQKFKKAHRITSRRVTKFVSRKNIRDRQKIEEAANNFVVEVRALMEEMPFAMFVNADQCGISKMPFTARTLAPVGVKEVECVVQSSNYIKSSYTFMPMVSVGGGISRILFVVLQEPGGKFPNKGHFQASNLVVRCHTLHIMTKKLMIEWFQTCVFTDDMPDQAVLLVDSWKPFKDHALIQSLVPKGKTFIIRNIPEGTTAIAQPLDVYGFRIYKAYMKKISGYVNANDLPFALHQRDNILKMISLVHNQFCCPMYRPFLQYSWWDCGYTVDRPPPFQTLVEYCFSAEVKECETEGCRDFSFIKCSYCGKFLCFNCFIVNYHFHE